jgi:hypothetical protein
VPEENEGNLQLFQSGLGASEIWEHHLPSKRAGRRNTQLCHHIWLSYKLHYYCGLNCGDSVCESDHAWRRSS